MQHPISLIVPPGMAVEEGERVTIRVSSRRPVRAKLVDEPLPGFVVTRADLWDELGRPDAGYRVATSRFGAELSATNLPDHLARGRDGLTVAFGAPGRGLTEMLDVAPGSVSEAVPTTNTDAPAGFDAWLNTIPSQGSETVRTEEAMFASLACLTLTE